MKPFYLAIICLFISNILSSQTSETESNNSFSTADLINPGGIINGKINESRDQDYFKISTTEGGKFTFKALSTPANIGLEVRIYDIDYVEFAYFKGTEGKGFTLEASHCTTGTYYVLIEDNGSAFNPDESYEFQLEYDPFSNVDPLECNNSFSDANFISTNHPYEAYLLGPFDNSPHIKDVDIYKFEVTNPGMFSLKIRDVASNMELESFIYLPDQQTIVASNSTAGDGNGYDLTFSLATTGTHYLWIEEDLKAFNTSVPYKFQLDFIPFQGHDNWEPNNSFSDAVVIPFGDTLCAHIAPPFDNAPFEADIDVYQLQIQEPGIINFNLFNVPANIEIESWIIAPNQQTNLNWETAAGDGAGYNLSLSIAEAGNYYLWMNEDGSASNMDSPYCFSVDFVPFSSVDPCEVNNSYSTACTIPLKDTITALINPWFRKNNNYNDVDIYKVEIPETGYFWFEAINVPGNYNLAMWCILSDQQTTLFNKTNAGVGQGYLAGHRICAPGTYYIYLEGSSWNAFESYQFTTHFVALSESDQQEPNEEFSTAYPLELCDTITGSIFNFCESNQEDFDFYSINMLAGERLPITVTSSTEEFKLCLEIYSPDGDFIERFTPNLEGEFFEGEIAASVTGKYYLKFSDCFRDGESLTGYTFHVGCDKLTSSRAIAVSDFVKVSPNPFSNYFNIEFESSSSQSCIVEIFDLKGKMLYRKDHEQKDLQISDIGLTKGTYFVKIGFNEFYQVQKLIKQ